MSVTREYLDRAGCDTPDCRHDHSMLHFHSKCHPKAGCNVYYEKATGDVVVDCHQCHKPVVRVKVAL